MGSVLLTLALAGCSAGGDLNGGASSSSAPAGSPLSSDITITQPQPGDTVVSPLTVTGEARGTWYFEASFPVRLLDGNGNELAVAPAQAQGDWMTEDFVPYAVTLTFIAPPTTTGTLVLEKDNPSGDPANAESVSIPVAF